jgi:tRNA pseudouridine55 synthase
VTIEDVTAAAAAFVGRIQQVPPMVSAVKVGGRRLHELAREGIEVERAPREVTVHALEVRATDDPSVVALDVRCSSGTYIRTLAADLGRALGGGAHVRRLRRTEVGSFGIAEAVDLEELAESDLMPPSAALRDYPAIAVDDGTAARVAHGAVLSRDDLRASGDGPWVVVDGGGEALAVYEAAGPARVKPAVVLVPATEGRR